MNYLKKGIVGIGVLALGVFGWSFTQDFFEISKNLDIFNSLYRELNLAYVDQTKPGQLMKTGIDAMLGSLDPYTIYYPETEIEDYRTMMTGEYGGIGASVSDINGKIIITEPFENFAAYKAGIRAGDQIVGVNGNNVVGKKSDDISSLLKGQAGTPVKLKILKNDELEPIEITLVREEIKHKAVPYSVIISGTKAGYIKLTAFTENCSQEVKQALQDLKSKGAESIVLDLRGNPGGLLYEAVNIVNLFIDKGQEVVYTKGRILDWEKTYLSVNNPVDTSIPLVVLVDGNSASASEIVSGSLQDLDRAVIVGQRTYGKGLVQQTKDLVYNTKVKITVAKYYIPSGRCVQALDYSNRDDEGRVEKVPDSLITAFKTKGGRIVYDGAGIMPDVLTKEEEPLLILYTLINKFLIFDYASRFEKQHKEIVRASSFALTDNEYQGFITYLNGKDYSYKTRSEAVLEELEKQCKEEGYNENSENRINELKAIIEKEKAKDLTKYKDQIKHYLEEEIISRYYFQTGKIEYNLKSDKTLAKGVQIASDASQMKSVLNNIEKPTKPFNPYKRF